MPQQGDPTVCVEDFIDETGFELLIQKDAISPKSLSLVAVSDNRIVGFARCKGNDLKRFSHQVEMNDTENSHKETKQ